MSQVSEGSSSATFSQEIGGDSPVTLGPLSVAAEVPTTTGGDEGEAAAVTKGTASVKEATGAGGRPSKSKKKAEGSKERVVEGPVNASVGGEVCRIGSRLTEEGLVTLREVYDIPSEVVLRVAEGNEVACSYNPGEVCLFEHMFQWGLSLPTEGVKGMEFLVAVLESYKLSPGQLTPNAFAIVLGFWLYIYSRFGEATPTSANLFRYFYVLKDSKGSGRFYFTRRPCKFPAQMATAEVEAGKFHKQLSGIPSNQKNYKGRFFFASFPGCQFREEWREIVLNEANVLPKMGMEDANRIRDCYKGPTTGVRALLERTFRITHELMLAPKLGTGKMLLRAIEAREKAELASMIAASEPEETVTIRSEERPPSQSAQLLVVTEEDQGAAGGSKQDEVMVSPKGAIRGERNKRPRGEKSISTGPAESALGETASKRHKAKESGVFRPSWSIYPETEVSQSPADAMEFLSGSRTPADDKWLRLIKRQDLIPGAAKAGLVAAWLMNEEKRRQEEESTAQEGLQHLLDSTQIKLDQERTAKSIAENAVKRLELENEDLREQAGRQAQTAFDEKTRRKALEVELKVLKEKLLVAQKEAVSQQEALLEAAREKEEAAKKAVADFKDSEEGIDWCETLGAESLFDGLREIVDFVKSKSPDLEWAGCPHYDLLSRGDTSATKEVPAQGCVPPEAPPSPLAEINPPGEGIPPLT